MTENRRTPSAHDNDAQTSSVLGGLPRSRPHRRSDKRAGSGGEASGAGAVERAAKPAAKAAKPAAAKPAAKAAKPAAAKPAAKAAKPAAAKPAAKAARPAAAKPAAKAPTPAPSRATPSPQGATTAKSAPSATPGRAQMRQPPQPRGLPENPPRRRPETGGRRDLVATAVQAAAELTEIGLSAGARALREAVSRLPRR